MGKGETVLGVIFGCPLVMVVMLPLFTDFYWSLAGCLSLNLITLQACGWCILVAKSWFKSTTKVLLYGYVVLLSIIAFVFMWAIIDLISGAA